jgi:hypothetical protein
MYTNVSKCKNDKIRKKMTERMKKKEEERKGRKL